MELPFFLGKKYTQSVLTASIKRKHKYTRNPVSRHSDSSPSITLQQDPKTVKRSKSFLKNTIYVE